MKNFLFFLIFPFSLPFILLTPDTHFGTKLSPQFIADNHHSFMQDALLDLAILFTCSLIFCSFTTLQREVNA